MTISADFWRQLSAKLQPEQLLRDPANCLSYSYDNGRHQAQPSGVVLAETVEQVQHTLRCCHDYQVPVTARGRGTGTPGGATPVPGGLILSLERLTNIRDFNPANRSLRIEAGVLNQTVQDLAATKNLFWPPDPSSAAYCTIGGNIATNGGGPRAVKYGTTRDNVLAIRAVTGTGALIETGFTTAKASCGFDLGRLLIGSEGTLAIIVEATLKLSPLQPSIATLQVWFDSENQAAHLVAELLQSPVIPCAVEFMDSACLDLLRRHRSLAIPTHANALLMIEIDGLTETLPEAVALINALCRQGGSLSIDSALTTAARASLWLIRKTLSPTLRLAAAYKINEDVVVPINQLPALLKYLKNLATRYAFTMVNFGHLGSGNLHVNVLLNHLDATIQLRVNQYLAELFQGVLALGGCLSGEHGIGIDKQPYVAQAICAQTLTLMKAVKAQFDPRHILNPGKFFP